ncbi:MAG: hypothetical protein KDB37_21875 [Ilumatobacter sp.]|nr:hypothetical protein [Ilumatobacter sp.]
MEPDGLAPAHALAVAFADALMTRPDTLDATTVRRLRETFTDEQLVELTLKVLKFNTQKINVALGTHRWVPADDVATATWNTDATYVPAD